MTLRCDDSGADDSDSSGSDNSSSSSSNTGDAAIKFNWRRRLLLNDQCYSVWSETY